MKTTTAPEHVLDLVERFETNLDAYKHGQYNETQVRREFLDPLFTALGWDVANVQGYAEAYKDVVHEDAIKVGRATKAPDYSFRIGGVRKFFVEAKKPSIHIKTDTHPAYQLRRYAWSAKLPLSILTDFEEFAVYDCRVKPQKTDQAAKARVMYLTFREYPNQWDALRQTFSKDAILKGAFDKYAESHKAKKGTAEVDTAFLQEIERWRDLLARNLALRNPRLTRRELNFAVQRTIDRLVFLRICEDRGIEEYGRLAALQNGTQVYQRLLKHFYQADDRYNSGIFHFRSEKVRDASPDALTPELTIDDKVLKDILKNLYYPDSPYEFAVLPADILGQVYEQFLGKVIRLTPGHQAKVEEKPEVKKAGGVYYTPTYIVEYIVAHTVGALLEGKTPQQAGSLRILDPACGSGSFLLGAYQYLLDWHRDTYLKYPEKWSKGRRPRLYQNDRGEWTLTIEERKRILLNNVYGVDIDAQAVEVTKLSLLLKVLEGEDDQTLSSQMALFQKRVLPDLSANIKCGNSLIGPDFYDGKQLTLLDEEEMYRINVFDWEREFAEIMRKGGFDVVIGNPPYVRSQFLAPTIKDFLSQNSSAPAYQPDTFAYFIQKGIDLLKNKGRLGYIIPNGILTNTYYARLRRYISEKTSIKIIVDLKDGVFPGASVDTSIFILCREQDAKLIKGNSVRIGEHLAKFRKHVVTPSNSVKQAIFLETSDCAFNTRIDAPSFEINRKIIKSSILLGEWFEVKAGMKVRKDFVTDEKRDEQHKPFIVGGGIKPYYLQWDGKWVRYNKHLEKAFTNQAFRDESIFLASPKLLIRQVMGQDRIYATIDSETYYVDQTIYILLPKENSCSLFYLLGLICSSIMTFYFSRSLADGKQTFPKIKGAQIKQLPIHNVDFSNPTDRANHDQMVELVERMLALHKQLHAATTPQAHTLLQRQIAATDRQIDRLVYELYGLTAEEIMIVEGK